MEILHKRARTTLLVLFLGLMGVRPAQAQPLVDRIVALYRTIEAATVDINQWKLHTNDSGSLAWNTSYLLESYVDMYEVTRDRTYVEKFVDLADTLAAGTDGQREIFDYQGRARVGWGSTSYSRDGRRVVFLVHSAMITYPLTRFAYLVRESNPLKDLANRAQKYQALAEAALHEFDSDWRYDPAKQEGNYVFIKGHPLARADLDETPVPFNMQSAVGDAFIMLSKLTGNPSYKRKAVALSRNLKEHLKIDSSDAYVWNYSVVSYSTAKVSPPPAPEDVSHGAEDVKFAVLAAQNSMVFTRDDIGRFSKAFFRFAGTVQKGSERTALDRWVSLSWASCGVYQAVFRDLMSRYGRQDAEVLLALAELAKYSTDCSPPE
jgi:hypothetical protein